MRVRAEEHGSAGRELGVGGSVLGGLAGLPRPHFFVHAHQLDRFAISRLAPLLSPALEPGPPEGHQDRIRATLSCACLDRPVRFLAASPGQPWCCRVPREQQRFRGDCPLQVSTQGLEETAPRARRGRPDLQNRTTHPAGRYADRRQDTARERFRHFSTGFLNPLWSPGQ